MTDITNALDNMPLDELPKIKCWLCMDSHRCYICGGTGSTKVWDAELHQPRGGAGMKICWRCDGKKTCPNCGAAPETGKPVNR